MPKRRREISPFQRRKSVFIDENVKCYLYPSLSNSPIFYFENTIIYGFGNILLLFCTKENKFLKKIQEHLSTIRSVDISTNAKYFLTSGDDKHIIIYDKNWNVLHKIIHKKKISKAFFLKYPEKEVEKLEILFIDKYGDAYVFDLDNVKDEMGSTAISSCESKLQNYEKGEIKLNYLYDTLNSFKKEEMEASVSIKEVDEAFIEMNTSEFPDEDYEEEDEDDDITNDEENTKNVRTDNNRNDNETNSNHVILTDKGNTYNDTKVKLDEHFKQCFQNKNALYPIFTCNSSTVTCLHCNDKYLIIGDKDEKIRILKTNKLHKIYNFYLYHKQFITSVTAINESMFCSAAADSCLCLWNIKTKKVCDFLFFDFAFVSTLTQQSEKKNFLLSKEWKFIISGLFFHEKTNALFGIMENVNGIFMFPLIKKKNSPHLQFDKERINFYPLHIPILSFYIISLSDTHYIFWVDQKNGYLHKMELLFKNVGKEEGDLIKFADCFSNEIKTFEHTFFNSSGKIDIGLVDYWKHTTLEENL